jgi:hypothetical protein
MTAFKDQTFNTRFGTMGDIAELAYEKWADDYEIRWDRFGFNRPRSNMFKWPAYIRYTPDYITHDRLVEVKGCGRDGLAKIKNENIEALNSWNEWMPVWIFIWNSSEKRTAWFEITPQFLAWLPQCESGKFPDNHKQFWKIPFEACVEQAWNR